MLIFLKFVNSVNKYKFEGNELTLKNDHAYERTTCRSNLSRIDKNIFKKLVFIILIFDKPFNS